MSSLMTAVVELRPDLKKFERETTKGVEQSTKKAGDRLSKGMADAGGKAGKKAGDEAGKGIEKGVTDGAKKAGASVEKEMDKAGTAATQAFNSKWDKVGSIGRKMTVGVTLPIVAGLNMAINAAGDLNETLGASEQVFGSSYAGMKQWADGAMESMGLAASTVLSSANSMGAMFIGMGATEDQAASMSQQVIERARDLAMLYNVSSEEMLTAMRSGMSGEMEPLKRFGVILSQTAVEAEAVSSGLVKAQVDTAKLGQAQVRAEKAGIKAAEMLKKYGEESIEYRGAAADAEAAEASLAEVMAGKVGTIDQATLAQARLQLLLRQSSTAAGQYKREEDSLAATQERSKEAAKNLAEEYGNKLLPFKVKLLEVATKVMDVFSKLPEGMQNAIIALAIMAAFAGPMMQLMAMLRGLGGMLVAVAARWGLVTASANTAAVAQQRASMMGGGMGKFGKGGLAIGGALAGGYLAYNGFQGAHKDGTGWGDAAGMIGGGAALGAAIGSVVPGVGTAIGALAGGVAGAGGSLGMWLKDNGYYPGLAEGGTVDKAGMSWVGERGPELLSLPRGAQVTPLPAMSGSTTINNYVTVQGGQFDERTLVAHLDQLARRAAATNTRTRRSVR